MKILITGGAGFQGSHLTKALLKKGHDVSVLNTFSPRSCKNIKPIKEKINLIWGSITDEETVNKSIRNQDVVFHMASHINVDESIANPIMTTRVNVLGTLNVLEAVRKNKNRLIFASTCEVYGGTEKHKLENEHQELNPQSPYAASKTAADRLCYTYFKTYGIKVTIVRPFNIFGPGQKDGIGGALIPIFIRRALQKKPLIVFGDGKQTRDYTYIDDIIKAYLLVLDSKKLYGEVINFGSSKEVSVIDIASYIAKKIPTKIKFIKGRPSEVRRFIADTTKAKKLLGFKPTVNIWTGIDRCIKIAKKAI